MSFVKAFRKTTRLMTFKNVVIKELTIVEAFGETIVFEDLIIAKFRSKDIDNSISITKTSVLIKEKNVLIEERSK